MRNRRDRRRGRAPRQPGSQPTRKIKVMQNAPCEFHLDQARAAKRSATPDKRTAVRLGIVATIVKLGTSGLVLQYDLFAGCNRYNR